MGNGPKNSASLANGASTKLIGTPPPPNHHGIVKRLVYLTLDPQSAGLALGLLWGAKGGEESQAAIVGRCHKRLTIALARLDFRVVAAPGTSWLLRRESAPLCGRFRAGCLATKRHQKAEAAFGEP